MHMALGTWHVCRSRNISTTERDPEPNILASSDAVAGKCSAWGDNNGESVRVSPLRQSIATAAAAINFIRAKRLEQHIEGAEGKTYLGAIII